MAYTFRTPVKTFEMAVEASASRRQVRKPLFPEVIEQNRREAEDRAARFGTWSPPKPTRMEEVEGKIALGAAYGTLAISTGMTINALARII